MATLRFVVPDRPVVTLVTDGATDETVLDAAVRAGLGGWIDTECGGIGDCGKCRCRVVDGATEPTEAELDLLTPEELGDGMRLACQLHTDRDMIVELSPAREMRRAKADLAGDVRFDAEPTVRKLAVSLPLPDLHDQRSDWRRLCQAVGVEPATPPAVSPSVPLLRGLPAALRSADFRVTAVLHQDDIIAVEPGDTTSQCLAAAVDIGTTTIAVHLLDLVQGRQLGVAAGANPQAAFGADIISRISAVIDNPAALAEMQRFVVSAINDLLGETLASARLERDALYEVVVVGNTCMLELFAGVDPRHLAATPYIPAFGELLTVPAAELGLQSNPAARVCLLPGIGGYVGADIVADILATNLHQLDGVRLLIDVGTNGEIVLAHDGRLITCATAAGPAFEGAHVACGMRAARGAIEHVSLDGSFALTVIGDQPAQVASSPVEKPVGLCGSGLLDAIAAMVRWGIVDASGRWQDGSRLSSQLGSRLFSRDGISAFRLAGAEDHPVYVSQHDVRQVQMAKAAIRSGVNILLQEFGLTSGDLDEVLLAGAFGSYLAPESALIIGMLPPVPLQRVRAVGNTAGDGARLAAVSTSARREAVAISRSSRYVELSVRKDFQSVFVKEIAFPVTADKKGDAR